MSPRTFNNLNIVETIDAILGLHHIDHRLIEFEITETTAMKDVQHTLATMQRFRQRGIRFSIDDFGTGYSSLSQLRTFPFNKIKIDGSFVRDLGRNQSSIAVIRAVTSIGGILGMIFVGVFATLSVNPAGADGLLYGNAMQLGKQLVGIVTIGAYAFAVTWGLGKLVDKTIGLRVSAAEEAVGLDLSQHGERAYGGLLR